MLCSHNLKRVSNRVENQLLSKHFSFSINLKKNPHSNKEGKIQQLCRQSAAEGEVVNPAALVGCGCEDAAAGC